MEEPSESLAPSDQALSSRTRRIQSVFGGSKALTESHVSFLIEYSKRLGDQESIMSSDSKQSRESISNCSDGSSDSSNGSSK